MSASIGGDDSRCHHDLPRVMCGVCSPAEPSGRDLRPSSAQLGPWFFARYDGECDDCGGDFAAGEKIRSDGEGGWLCEDCGDS